MDYSRKVMWTDRALDVLFAALYGMLPAMLALFLTGSVAVAVIAWPVSGFLIARFIERSEDRRREESATRASAAESWYKREERRRNEAIRAELRSKGIQPFGGE